MDGSGDMTIHIYPKQAEIVVEQQAAGGVTQRKNITPQSLLSCLISSQYDEQRRMTGLLPEHCIAAALEETNVSYFIRYPEQYADISYYGTAYLKFPLPHLVFDFRHMPLEGKVARCRLCVVENGPLTLDTPTYRYPFSNVSSDGSICTGNNALPVYKDPTRLHTLAGYILRLPNNNDHFSASNNRAHLGYRDLLEELKDKTPDYYYSDILVKDGKTLKDFLNGR